MEVIPTGSSSNPLLAIINSIENTIPENRYVVYYQIPIYEGMFRSIKQIKEMLITDKNLKFKILDLQSPQDLPLYLEGIVQSKKPGTIAINLKHKEGEINMKGTIINKANDAGIVFSMSVSDINGYLNFLKFREKYRTLENITRKQSFKLDHRLKIIDGSTVFYFSLEESDHSHYFFTNRKITVQVQEIYSIEDWNTIQVILENQLDLSQSDNNIKAIINILQKLKITLDVQAIKNVNYTTSEIACLRVMQMYPSCGQIKIGTDKIGQLANVKPVLKDQFYDYQFGYLNENINEISSSGGSSVYQHIDKITKSFPHYPHLKNSKLIDINGSKFLIFSYELKNKTQKIIVPFVYILQGLNIIQNQTHKIKFFIEFNGQLSEPVIQKTADVHRMYDLRLKDVWNLGQICQIYKDFKVKIVSPGLNYSIPFATTQIQANTFKKQAKQLDLKEQYGQFNGNRYFLLTSGASPNKLMLTKTESLSDFYLFDLYNSSSITFQIVSYDNIVAQGTLLRQQIIRSKGNLRVVLSSPDSLTKIILIFEANEISQKNKSLRTYYKFMYKLEYTDTNPADNIQYDLQIKRLTDNKKFRAKVFPQISDDGVSTLHYVEGGFFESTLDDMELNLMLRKMYYSEETEHFDNEQVINKKIIVNSSPRQVLQKNCMFLTLKQEGYTSIQFDFYDQNIKKRLKLYLQVYMRKLPVLDLDQGRYTIKIPQYLWKLNTFSENIKQITMEVHLSNRKKKGQKISIYPDSPQQYYLPHHNYKDGLSMIINGQIGYDKILDAIKIRCDVTKDGIGWFEESQWYLGAINVNDKVFYFMIKFAFDPNANNGNEGSQRGSSSEAKTAGKRGSQRSYSQKIDPLAKTVSNFQLLKLKKMKNDLTEESRHLTAKYVQREETIINLRKKIGDLEQKIRKQKRNIRQTEQSATSTTNTAKKSKNNEKMKQLYRSICQCGARNPQFNGFCQDCLKQLKKKYEMFQKQYNEKSYQYEKICFDKFNAKQKYYRVKNKLRNYKQKLKAGQDIQDDGLNDMVKQLEQGDIKRKIQENKIELFRLQEEREKLDTNSKQRLNALEDMIRKEDIQIWKYTLDMQKIKQQLDDLNIKIKEGQNKPNNF